MTTLLFEPLNGTPVPFVEIAASRLSKYGIEEYTRPDQARILTYGAGWLKVYELDDGRVEFSASQLPDHNRWEDMESILNAVSTEFGVEVVWEDDDRFRCWMSDEERFGLDEDDLGEGDAATGGDVIPLERKH